MSVARREVCLRTMSWRRRLAAVCLPAALLLLNAPAHATDPMRPRVAVFDFHDMSAYPTHVLGLRAAARLQVELKSAGRFELIPRADVRRECAAADLKPPFAVGYQQQILARVAGDLALTGIVRECKVDSRAPAATVTLVAELAEAIGGEQIALLKGSGTARGDRKRPVPIDELVEEALAMAGQQVAQGLISGPQVTGKVVAVAADKRVMLQAGGDAPFVPGMRALILRPKEGGGHLFVAVLSVELAQKEKATAKVLSAREDAREGDDVVGIFGGGR